MSSDMNVERVSDRELVVTRTFDGPAQLIFDAWTKPELLKRWWAPKSLGVTLFECESDLRPGGKYRYVFGRDPNDPEVFSGFYKEVDPPFRLVMTRVYERFSDAGEAVISATFAEREGRTHLTLHQRYATKEALDGAVASGMEHGMRETLCQLEVMISSHSGEREAEGVSGGLSRGGS
jgi:uncharacterized protein YndB with AHSA1/START domain